MFNTTPFSLHGEAKMQFGLHRLMHSFVRIEHRISKVYVHLLCYGVTRVQWGWRRLAMCSGCRQELCSDFRFSTFPHLACTEKRFLLPHKFWHAMVERFILHKTCLLGVTWNTLADLRRVVATNCYMPELVLFAFSTLYQPRDWPISCGCLYCGTLHSPTLAHSLHHRVYRLEKKTFYGDWISTYDLRHAPGLHSSYGSKTSCIFNGLVAPRIHWKPGLALADFSFCCSTRFQNLNSDTKLTAKDATGAKHRLIRHLHDLTAVADVPDLDSAKNVETHTFLLDFACPSNPEGGPFGGSSRAAIWLWAPSLFDILIIWNIMGTFFVIIFAVLGTKLVRSSAMAVRYLSKFLRNTIPKWWNKDALLWHNSHPGGAKRCRGVYLLTYALYLIASGLYFVEM